MPDTRKSVLITGSSPGGIGFSLAKEFNSKGFRVFATARDKKVLSELEGEGIETISLDVTSSEQIQKVKAEVFTRTGGKLDFLVNNAGRNYTMPALDVDFDEVRATFETNVYAPMQLTQVFAPLLIASRGTVVNIGSVAAIVPYTFGSVYNASKGALHSWSNTLRVELAPYNVRVVLVVTGGVKSRIARTTRSLPPDSLYLAIDSDYQRRQKHSQEGATPHSEYAQRVVAHVTSGKTGIRKWLWEGNKSWLIWFVWRFLPNGYFDDRMKQMFGLDRLASIVAGQVKKD